MFVMQAGPATPPDACRHLKSAKVLLREADENKALKAVAAMQQGRVIELDCSISISASRLGLKHDMPMMDSIILATARRYDCVVWTLDRDFEGLDNVKFFPQCPKCKNV